MNAIVSGKQSISADFAIDLEQVLGTEAEMWLHLQSEYDEAQARKERAGKSKKD